MPSDRKDDQEPETLGSEISETTPSQTSEAPEETVSDYERAEAGRRRRVWRFTLAGLLGLALCIFLGYRYHQALFGTKLPIKASQKKIDAETNDPQCHAMIDHVTAIGHAFFKLEPLIQANLLGNDPDKVGVVKRDVDNIKERLRDQYRLSKKASLRFKSSRKQLNHWFSYMQTELGVFDKLADGQLAKIRAAKKAAKEAAAKNGSHKPKAGKKTTGVQVAGPAKKPTNGKKANKFTPKTQRDATLVAVHESFENFRVWHTAGPMPCGKASKGETPWHPPKKAAKPAPGAAK